MAANDGEQGCPGARGGRLGFATGSIGDQAACSHSLPPAFTTPANIVTIYVKVSYVMFVDLFTPCSHTLDLRQQMKSVKLDRLSVSFRPASYYGQCEHCEHANNMT